jgi:hypothetical protein
MVTSFNRSSFVSLKLGLKKLRDEYVGLDRLDRAELDEEDAVPSERADRLTDTRRVA